MYIINKFNSLLTQERKIFHTRDLALLWRVENGNTLRTTISRYIKKGTLQQVHKGLYATVPLSQLDQYELARAIIHDYCYLSCESILANAGVIHQQISTMTFVSSKSRNFTLPSGQAVKVRQLSPQHLFNPIGINEGRADIIRATADLLYYAPSYYLDSPQLIDQDKLTHYQKVIGYK